MLDSKALTKIQSIILIAIVVVAAVAAYVLWNGESQSSETIKIGVCVDLDGNSGMGIWRAVVLAAEQLNAEGGILGKQVEVIGEDNDAESGADMVVINTALNRLITSHKVDFIIGAGQGEAGLMCQDIAAEHKKIIFSPATTEELTQRVLDDYEKYKYFFRVNFNESSTILGVNDGLLLLRENTGFNKVAIIGQMWAEKTLEGLEYLLAENGFDLVYNEYFPYDTFDFSSYFSAAEAAGAEVFSPLIVGDASIAFVKEWYDRQSPIFVYGGYLGEVAVPEAYEWTDGKCEHTVVAKEPIVIGHPLTSKTLETRDLYQQRWDETPGGTEARFYDLVRFVLADAIERAGTIETEAVIKALEETCVETSVARNWVFTDSHDVMMGENPNNPNADYLLMVYYQWQNGEMIPVYPKMLMEEAGASYTFPDWPGPWDNIN